MSFIQRELDKLTLALSEPQEEGIYPQLHAAQQALAWALEPRGVKSPYEVVMGIPANSEDYFPITHLPVS